MNYERVHVTNLRRGQKLIAGLVYLTLATVNGDIIGVGDRARNLFILGMAFKINAGVSLHLLPSTHSVFYQVSHDNEIDPVSHLNNSQVGSMASAYRKGQ